MLFDTILQQFDAHAERAKAHQIKLFVEHQVYFKWSSDSVNNKMLLNQLLMQVSFNCILLLPPNPHTHRKTIIPCFLILIVKFRFCNLEKCGTTLQHKKFISNYAFKRKMSLIGLAPHHQVHS